MVTRTIEEFNSKAILYIGKPVKVKVGNHTETGVLKYFALTEEKTAFATRENPLTPTLYKIEVGFEGRKEPFAFSVTEYEGGLIPYWTPADVEFYTLDV